MWVKILLILGLLPVVIGQNHGSCLSSGGLAGVIFGCIFGTIIATLVIIFFLWRHLKPDKHGSITEHFCYDNPQFKNQVDRENNADKIGLVPHDTKRVEKCSNRASREVEKGTFVENGLDLGSVTRKKRLHSIYANWWKSSRDHRSTESLGSINQYVTVPLISRDFTGLGFGIHGNMRDGIFIKNLLSRGPAKEGGKIHEGDKIIGLYVNFENMAFEDAQTIISYASPYPITLEIQKADSSKPLPQTFRSSRRFSADRTAQFHPLIKSQSIDDIGLNNSFYQTSTLERKPKSLRYSNPKANQKPLDNEKTVIPMSPLEVENKEPLNKSLKKTLSECKNSESSIESLDNNCKVIVTAEISQPPKYPKQMDIIIPPARAKTKVKAPPISNVAHEKSPENLYNDLSYEEKLQVIALSYEDPEMSQSTPNLSRPSSDTEDIVKKIKPQDSHGTLAYSSNFLSTDSRKINSVRKFTITPVDENSNDNHNSNLSSASSNENMSEFNKEQYDKLVYFQSQLARQQEELAKLGINIPVPLNSPTYAGKI